MFIYFNGDSFTAGAELIDETLPGFPGLKPNIESKNFTTNNWFKTKNEHIKSWKNEYLQKCKDESWCATLSNLLNAEHINGAKSGSSMLGITTRTSVDLLKLKAQGIIPDAVIIQLTSNYRTAIYDADATDNNFVTDDFIINNIFTEDPHSKKKNYVSAWVDLENYESMILRWLHQVHLLQHTVKSITGKMPILVDSIFMTGHFMNQLNKMRQLEIPNLFLQDIGLLEEFDSRLRMMTFFDSTEMVMPLGHFVKPVHDRFATSIKNTIFNN